MVPVSPRTRSHIERLFDGEDRARVEALLAERCGGNLPLWHDTTPEGFERIRFAVLKLSAGDLDQLASAIRDAGIDWRDVLVRAGFAEHPEAHRAWESGATLDEGRLDDRARRSPAGALRSGYAFLFWGMLLVALDIRLDGVDVLPDFVGYLLVAIGAGRLRSRAESFVVASRLAWVLLVTSLVLPAGPLLHPVLLADLALWLWFLWVLLGAVATDTEARGITGLPALAKRFRAVILILTVVGVVSPMIGLEALGALAGIVAVAFLIAVLWLLHVAPRRGAAVPAGAVNP